MFPFDANSKQKTYSFIAAFYIGVPLAVSTSVSSSWSKVLKKLSEAFSSKPDLFIEVTDIEFQAEIEFPLGRPFVLRHRNFFEIFDLSRYLEEAGLPNDAKECSQESIIWICPSGIVLVMASKDSKEETGLTLEEFEDKVVEQHYSELSYIFSEVAYVLIPMIGPEFLDSALCCKDYLEKCKKLQEVREGMPKAGKGMGEFTKISDYFQQNSKTSDIFKDALIDVYYIEFLYNPKDEDQRIRVGYVDSSFVTRYTSHPLYICIGFSSFVGFRCVVRHLTMLTRTLGENLRGLWLLKNTISYDFKMLRIFCLQLIHESSPIQIRLTRRYMEIMENYSKASRMPGLIGQINDQLVTLDQMVDWLSETTREIRNIKIGIAAIILAIVSVMAVAAQLISTIDVNARWGVMERCFLISSGFVFGMLITIGIYVFPLAKWFFPRKFLKKK